MIPASFSLFGQRFSIDAFVQQNIVFDRVIKDQNKIPKFTQKGLDVMFALGNYYALNLLEKNLKQHPYHQNLYSLRKYIDSFAKTIWQQTSYNHWLNMIRNISNVKPYRKISRFLHTEAWQKRVLNSMLVGWSHLRYDNILYTKQPASMGTICYFPYGYVEPSPMFFDGVIEYTDRMKHIIEIVSKNLKKESNNDLTSRFEKYKAYFKTFKDIAIKLKNIADKQLANQELTAKEIMFIQDMIKIGFYGKEERKRPCLPASIGSKLVKTGWYYDLYLDDEERGKKINMINPRVPKVLRDGYIAPEIADVYTNANAQSAPIMETAIGNLNIGFLIQDTPKGEMMFVTPLMSYYEFYNHYRLANGGWRKRYSENPPQREKWCQSYMTLANPNEAKVMDLKFARFALYNKDGRVPRKALPASLKKEQEVLELTMLISGYKHHIKINSTGIGINQWYHKEFGEGMISVESEITTDGHLIFTNFEYVLNEKLKKLITENSWQINGHSEKSKKLQLNLFLK